MRVGAGSGNRWVTGPAPRVTSVPTSSAPASAVFVSSGVFVSRGESESVRSGTTAAAAVNPPLAPDADTGRGSGTSEAWSSSAAGSSGVWAGPLPYPASSAEAWPKSESTRSSSPSPSSATYTTRSAPSGRPSRARIPGVAWTVRDGPSRWVSQCRVPWLSTTLAVPSAEGTTAARWAGTSSGRGRRAVAAEPRRMSRTLGSASSDSSSQIRPADSNTTRCPSVAACRA